MCNNECCHCCHQAVNVKHVSDLQELNEITPISSPGTLFSVQDGIPSGFPDGFHQSDGRKIRDHHDLLEKSSLLVLLLNHKLTVYVKNNESIVAKSYQKTQHGYPKIE